MFSHKTFQRPKKRVEKFGKLPEKKEMTKENRQKVASSNKNVMNFELRKLQTFQHSQKPATDDLI